MGLEKVIERIGYIQQRMRDFRPQGLKGGVRGYGFMNILNRVKRSGSGEGTSVASVGGSGSTIKTAAKTAKTAEKMGSMGSMGSMGKMGKMGKIGKVIREASDKYGVSESLIRAVIRAESNFNPRAVSSAGAGGLMQLMPETAKELGVKDRFDIRENVLGGVKYLRGLLDRFDGDIGLSLASYNAGIGRVMVAGGIPNIQETRDYVKKVVSSYEKLKG